MVLFFLFINVIYNIKTSDKWDKSNPNQTSFYPVADRTKGKPNRLQPCSHYCFSDFENPRARAVAKSQSRKHVLCNKKQSTKVCFF